MNRTALLAGLGVSLVGAALLAVYMQRFQLEASGGAPVDVLTVTADIAAGEPITTQKLGVRQLPERFVESRHIRVNDRDRIIGIRVATAVRANQSLLWSDLTTSGSGRQELSSLLREGMRAMNISVSSTETFAGLLRPGDRVDVLLTGTRPPAERGADPERITIPLLQNVLVLAVGRDTGNPDYSGDDGNLKEVSIAVTIEQAGLVAHAGDRGELSLVLRNPRDVDIIEEVQDTLDSDLIEPARREQIQRGGRRRTPEPEPTMIERVQ